MHFPRKQFCIINLRKLTQIRISHEVDVDLLYRVFSVSSIFSYGDKTPKFILGRVFGVLWILIGLVVIAMFTATATSALSISFSDLARLEGNKVKQNG